MHVIRTSKSADGYIDIDEINKMVKYRSTINELKKIKIFDGIIKNIEKTVAYEEIGDIAKIKKHDALT